MNERKRIQLLTPDEIMSLGEEFGFVYEPIRSVCKLGKLRTYWGCMDYIDGKPDGPHSVQFDKDWFTEEDYKRTMALDISWKFVNEVFVFDMTEDNLPCAGYISGTHAHFDQRVWCYAHTPLTVQEQYEKYAKSKVERAYWDYACELKKICDKYRV